MKHPVDLHVGQRVRQRRWLLGMTQQQLAEKVGIKFQQIQNMKPAPTGSAHRDFGIFQKSWMCR